MIKGKYLILTTIIILLAQSAFAATGTYENYNTQTKFSFVGYDSTSTAGHSSRGSNHITGTFNIGSTYSGRLGILKYCGNSIIDSGEECDGTNLNSQTCSTQGYATGTLTCTSTCSFNTAGCTAAQTTEEESISPGGSYSGTSKSITKLSTTKAINIQKGKLEALTTAQDVTFKIKGNDHIVDIKQITQDTVKLWIYSLWIYSEPIEIILQVGKRANVDLDNDGWADVRTELRGIKNSHAFLYFKELQEPPQISIPEGKQATIEEPLEMPRETSEIKLMIEEAWTNTLNNVETTVQTNVDWCINKIKKNKLWLIPLIAAAGLILLFFAKSLKTYFQKRRLKETIIYS